MWFQWSSQKRQIHRDRNQIKKLLEAERSEEWGMIADGHVFLFEGDENILELDGDDGMILGIY